MDKMKELRDMVGEMSTETDVFGPEETDQFTYEHGYYSCKVEYGMHIDDCDYDQTRYKEIKKVYDEYLTDKFRR